MASNNRENNNPGAKEMVLATKRENPHQFFEPGTPLPIKKQKRKISPVLITILILISAAFAFYWAYSGDNNSHLTRKRDTSVSNVATSNNIKEDAIEDNSSPSSSNNFASYSDSSSQGSDHEPGKISKKYIVISKAWFHYKPDSARVKPLYLMPRKEVVLKSSDEENGYVYVVYINSKGEATHGWLDKDNLQPVD